jgi:hypothetical protein
MYSRAHFLELSTRLILVRESPRVDSLMAMRSTIQVVEVS